MLPVFTRKPICREGRHATIYIHVVPAALLTFKVIQGQ